MYDRARGTVWCLTWDAEEVCERASERARAPASFERLAECFSPYRGELLSSTKTVYRYLELFLVISNLQPVVVVLQLLFLVHLATAVSHSLGQEHVQPAHLASSKRPMYNHLAPALEGFSLAETQPIQNHIPKIFSLDRSSKRPLQSPPRKAHNVSSTHPCAACEYQSINMALSLVC